MTADTNHEIEQCRIAAVMIVDALVMSGLLKEADFDQAEGIVQEELLVRKAMSKL